MEMVDGFIYTGVTSRLLPAQPLFTVVIPARPNYYGLNIAGCKVLFYAVRAFLLLPLKVFIDA